MTTRLDAFPAALRRRISSRMAARLGEPNWPALEGCVCILFASRSGSTLLCREIERRYRFRRINESLNLPRIAQAMTANGLGTLSEAIGRIVAGEGEGGWFGFKAGPQGLIAAETAGFLGAHLHRTRFVLLLRRDLVGQAVSLVKAEQTLIWHSTQIGTRIAEPAHYSHAAIARAVRNILGVLDGLRRYVDAAERPCARLYYEDFAVGDATCVETACDALGLPRRRATRPRGSRAIAKIGDEVNLAWAQRFNLEMDDETAKAVAGYAASCAEANPDRAAASKLPARRTRTAKSPGRKGRKRRAS